jgi:hypothetical protein
MAYQYPGQAFYHTLKPLKGWYAESGIDAAGKLSSNVNIASTNQPATRGLVVHPVGVQTYSDVYGGTTTGPQLFSFEMGWGAGAANVPTGLPMILWTPPTDPDASNPGVTPGTAPQGTTSVYPEWVSALPPYDGGNLVALVLSGAYELETTEYDTNVALTYTVGDPLRCVTSNTDANAGKITNQRGTTAAFNTAGLCQYVGNSATVSTWDSLIGFVSRAAYVNSNKRQALAFYAYPVPGNR